jgi:hypothetical protein
LFHKKFQHIIDYFTHWLTMDWYGAITMVSVNARLKLNTWVSWKEIGATNKEWIVEL